MFFWHVSQQFPSGYHRVQRQPISSFLAKWLFSIPLPSPNLEDNSHLARWTLESKYVGCFPQHGGFVNFLDDFVGSCVNETSWADLKWSDIYLHELPKKGPVLSLAPHLLFGGISDIARTPGPSRPAVPLHLGMLERLAMTVTFLGCALPVKLTQTTKGHTRPLHRPPRTVASDHRSLTMSKQMLNPTRHPHLDTWWNQYLKKKKLHGFWGHQEKLGQHNHINVT